MNDEIDRIVGEAIRHARSRNAVVVDLPHLALAIREAAGQDGSAAVSPALDAAAARVDTLPRRDRDRDHDWSPGVVPVSNAFRSWLQAMESPAGSDEGGTVIERAVHRLSDLVPPAPSEDSRPSGRVVTRSGAVGAGHQPPYVFEFTPEALERFDPYIGNDDLVALTLGVLARPRKRNPVLVGAAGVGKTALVVEIARRLHSDRVPGRLKGSRVFQVDLGTAVAGTRYRGDFEERMSWLSRRLLDDPKSVFFIDEIHLVLNVGSGEGGIDAASLLKPALSNGVGALIGATTRDQAHHLESDAPLARRLVFVPVAEPSVDHTRLILSDHARRLEAEFGLHIPDEVVEAALRAGSRLRPHRHLPDAALDILDLAASLSAIDQPDRDRLTVEATGAVARFVSEGLDRGGTPRDLLGRGRDLWQRARRLRRRHDR